MPKKSDPNSRDEDKSQRVRKKKPKEQLSARVFPVQKKRLRRYQYEWGYPSMDKALRRVLREYEENRQWKAKYLDLLNAAKTLLGDAIPHGRLPGNVADDEEQLRAYLTNYEHEAESVRRYASFKVQCCQWDPDLAHVELKHLSSYQHWRRTGEVPLLDADEDEVMSVLRFEEEATDEADEDEDELEDE